jgi:hypothetical protein
VLAVHHVPTGKWGALGISRRTNLMYKPLGADSLADLMADFKVQIPVLRCTHTSVAVS